MRARALSRLASAAVAALATGILLAGCGAGPQAPVPTYTPKSTNSSTPAPGATASPGEARLFPDGTAAQNLAYFDLVNQELFASAGRSDGRTIIDNLVAAGFQKVDMEVTPDETAIGLEADSIIFSIRFSGQCLIGQFTRTAYASELGAVLGTGSCLVGETRPIDW